MIKYLGSKRRLVPMLTSLFAACRPQRALDLFSGTTRVGQALKGLGARVTAVDATRCAYVLARCYIETDAETIDEAGLSGAINALNAVQGQAGYVTEIFCHQARYFQPHNGERIDAVRDVIERDYRASPLEPVLLTSLIEAADRVDSTTGLQMAYLKSWAPRSFRPLELRRPALLSGGGVAIRGDARELAPTLGSFDVAYLDPPYNQHRYPANYHVWETLVAWDAPEAYGVARKRVDLRESEDRSVFNRRASMPGALAQIVAAVDARVVVISYNDESWITLDELVSMASVRGRVEVLAFDSKRYVGAQIGVHDPSGRRVGTPGRLRNVEYVVIAGEIPSGFRSATGLGHDGSHGYLRAR